MRSEIWLPNFAAMAQGVKQKRHLGTQVLSLFIEPAGYILLSKTPASAIHRVLTKTQLATNALCNESKRKY